MILLSQRLIMDPITAVLASTDLASSLITMVETIFKVSQKLLELQQKYKNAPRKIVQLYHDLQNLRALVMVIQARFPGNEAMDYPPALRAVCESFTVQLEQDLQKLETVVNRSHTKSGSLISKGFKTQACQMLTETTINEFHGRISTHIGYLSMVQALINNYKVDNLRQNNLELLEETRTLFGLMSSQAWLLKSISRRQQTLPALAPGEYTYKQERDKALSSLKRYEKQKMYDFGLGLLSVQVFKVRSADGSTPFQGIDGMQLKVTFLPRSWFSRTTLQAIIDVPGESSVTRFRPKVSLQPTTINQSPELLNAIHGFNLKQLRRLFETDQARPTDMVMDLVMNEPVTLCEALLRVFLRVIPCSHALSKHKELLSFILSQGISHSAEAATIFFLGISRWSSDQPQSTKSTKYYLRTLLDHNAVSLDTFSVPSALFVPPGWYMSRFGKYEDKTEESILSALIEGTLSFDSLKDCLFHQSQSWILEDLSGRDLWYVAILAHVDQSFWKALRAYVRSFRSSVGAQGEDSMESLLSSVLDINKITSEVEKAKLNERSLFLKTIARKGEPTMLAPFLKIRIQLDEGDIFDNYLGNAATKANVEIFKMLLNAGASAARAIPMLCTGPIVDVQLFNNLFAELVDNLTPARDQIQDRDLPDPLNTILKNEQALASRPDAPQFLLKNNILLVSRLHGSNTVYPCHSYIFNALCYNRIEALKLLLEHGPPINIAIMDMFATDREHLQSIANYTWLTLAVEVGRSECVRLILARAEDQEQAVNSRDGVGRTALQIVQSSIRISHPRNSVLSGLHWVKNQDMTLVPAAEDEATLLILQAAAGIDAVTTLSVDERILGNEDVGPPLAQLLCARQSYLSSLLNQIESVKTRAIDIISELLHFPPKGFSSSEVVMACPQEPTCLECRNAQIRSLRKELWVQLIEITFLDVASYVIMVCLVILYDISALIFLLSHLRRHPWPFWVVTSEMLLFAWASGRQLFS